ncbi:MAG: S46 family peptidase [Bacteroidota bacterium]
MKKLYFLLSLVMLCSIARVKADEGMWLPLFIDRLNYVDMQKMGLRLTAEEIYSVNHSSVKDAIIIFGRGCTGEIVSGQGLVFTNHHCGYGSIQSHSSVEHDYLTNGFWATRKEEELPNEGLTASFLVRIEDVGAKVLGSLDKGLSEEDRMKKVQEISKKIEDEATNGTQYTASVKSFYNGNEYYLFVYQVFKDVRLVGTPPNSIGKFGGDTDNWMWPRHTCDFSVFRVYTAPDGKPATYSKDNVPLKPKHFLPVSIKGVQKGDYTMIMGYPGTTNRYLSSYGVRMAIDESNPSIVSVREKKLAIIKEDMNASDKVRIQYSAKYASIANYWKYYIGQTRGLKRLKVFDEKKGLEDKFSTWVNADNARKEKYGSALNDIQQAFAQIIPFAKTRVYYTEGILRGSEVLAYSRSFESLVKELKADKPDQAKIDAQVKTLREKLDAFYKDLDPATDQKLLGAVMKMFGENVAAENQPSYFIELKSKYNGNFDEFATDAFKKSMFSDRAKVEAFLSKPKAKSLEKDILFHCMQNFYEKYNLIVEKLTPANNQLARGNRLFLAGLREMMPEKKFAPDANSTMRLTYGQVLDYYPADAVHYDYTTTLKGVMEKEDPKVDEFIVPAKLKELYKAKDYGQYGKDGELVTCFLTNTDITGGNSGSPVLNGNGELIGLAFDGNWEAMSGDIAFEPDLQRTIAVDARYVLFVIDKFAGAKNIIAELDIRK